MRILSRLLPTVCLASTLIAGDERPTSELPYTPSLDVRAMDRTVDPCEDLYTYACGGWKRNNPIPPDQARWSVYGKAYVDNQRFLWGLLERAADAGASRTPAQQKIGDYFAACMDAEAVARAGAAPLEADLRLIDAMQSIDDLGRVLGTLHARIMGDGLFFASGAEQDARDSERVIAAIYAGGLGLPDRDYYVNDEPRFAEIRSRYVEHVAKMLSLLGQAPAAAREEAATVLRLETALARVTLTPVERRDPYNVYHRYTPKKLRALAPSLDWAAYFAASGLEPQGWLNVAEPTFVAEFEARLKQEPLNAIKTYLRWGVVSALADYLAPEFADESFAFHRKFLRGVEQQPPRWKRCVGWVDRDLGEALGQEFVARVFPPEIKGQTVEMTHRIQEAMRRRVAALDWMSVKTKRQAYDKLDKMRNKVGYPEVWRDYSSLSIEHGDFFGNVSRAMRFEIERQARKIGRPVDRDEWSMSPPTVNAYYNPSMNDINFPAGVLLPPLYDATLDAAPNYGNTGATIGHELTHGFDDEGRRFDGDGNLRDWWTKRDGKAFETRAQCVRDQYAQYVIVDDIRITGDLTSGEDIADLGGTILAWEAWREATRGQALAPADGLTPEQRFFVGFAQWACANRRPEDLRVNAITAPHSPEVYRINGVVTNMPEFAQAFACKPDAALVRPPEQICKVW